ncbi:uncharacterized protein LOC109841454 [Asparagus officinalis]|uniref:uncharacterized protein LOC109841454 n=1 Tax=Asparagus officinalis TaxID=4686 RepID=UPI00098E04AE|nr:uncharacterized protein LOC109841454 [Asparagus officinalis]
MANNPADKQSVPSHSNAMPSPTSGINMNYMPVRPQPFTSPPHTFSPFPPWDGNYGGMTQPPMSYMSMLGSPQGLMFPTASSQSSGPNQFSPNTGDSVGKDIHDVDGAEHTSPLKRGKRLAHKKKVPCTRLNSRGVANKFWLPEHDDVLIPYLADLALDGMKPDKNFKAEAYKMAAMKINMQFRTDFTHLHVINHLKCLRNKFNDMKACLDISGAGWDETSKMITLDEETLKSWAQDKSNSKYKAYINKPLPHFKNLQVIMGDDQAKGDFVRPVYANIGSSRSIPIPDDDCEILEESEAEPQSDACNAPRSGAVNQPQPTRYKTKSKDNTTSSSSKKTRKFNREEEMMCAFVESMSQSMRNQHVIHWTEQLATALNEHRSEYSEEFLDRVLDHLYDNEREGKLSAAHADAAVWVSSCFELSATHAAAAFAAAAGFPCLCCYCWVVYLLAAGACVDPVMGVAALWELFCLCSSLHLIFGNDDDQRLLRMQSNLHCLLYPDEAKGDDIAAYIELTMSRRGNSSL